MSRETIVEKKCKCDICGDEIYTNQKTGEPYCGVHIRMFRRIFFGLFGSREREIDICKKCYSKLTGKTEKDIGW